MANEQLLPPVAWQLASSLRPETAALHQPPEGGGVPLLSPVYGVPFADQSALKWLPPETRGSKGVPVPA